MKLYLIRHGRTEASEKRLYCGSTDLPLSPSGAEEIKRLAAEGIYPDMSGCAVYTSGMRRADETLALITGAADRAVIPELREMDFGAFEMHSYDELKENADYIAWISGDNEKNVCPGGESGEGMTLRVKSALDRLLRDGRDALVVSHGGPTAAMMAMLFPGEEKNRYQWQPSPGRGYAVNADGEHLGYTAI
ncbi:MAG: histidine phosphatase family protein [Oscillospiraceae bacterium]|nr:histidine phosphatase family protein [Oscillospiraceae bacterium]